MNSAFVNLPSSTEIVDESAMWAFAAQLEPFLVGGETIALHGDLGAGKTCFTQGLAHALGITAPITSPTYAIIHEYPSGRLPLIHMDLYRLHGPDDLIALDYEDYLEGNSICVIEWPSRAADLLPEDTLHITITLQDHSTTRTLTLA